MTVTNVELRNILDLVPNQEINYDYDFDDKGNSVGSFRDDDYVIPVLDFYIDLIVSAHEVYYGTRKIVYIDVFLTNMWKDADEVALTLKQIQYIQNSLKSKFNLS